MAIKLPVALIEAVKGSSPFGTIAEIDDQIAVLALVPAAEQRRFRNAPVRYQYALARYDLGPVLCLAVEILDDPSAPYGIEAFLNVADAPDLATARQLAVQEELAVHFLDEYLHHTLSKTFPHRPVNRLNLAAMIDQALAHLATLAQPPNWHQARQQFMRDVPRA